jgi:23S rRNA pseudouridine1911/1915/1917 synthase
VSITFTVSESLDGVRLDRALALHAPRWSRTRWQAAISEGMVTVNGRRATTPATVLHAGDSVAAPDPPEPAAAIPLQHEPLAVPVPIRYRDDDVLVVSKPAGLVVHPAAGHAHGTLVQGLWPELEGAGGPSGRVGVVHRLDRDTAGLMMLARTEAARMVLSRALARREVHRRYWALVEGRLDPPEGRIAGPIGRHPRHRMRMAVVPQGRPAATRYRTQAMWGAASWVALELETGRTHQVRVHLASVGHPVLGDPLYGAGPTLGLPHQALFAYALTFQHPTRSGRSITVVEPWPESWAAALSDLGDPTAGTIPDRHDLAPVVW